MHSDICTCLFDHDVSSEFEPQHGIVPEEIGFQLFFQLAVDLLAGDDCDG